MNLLSVVTPVYQAAKHLPDTYKCLCRQTFTEWEWVVVDDGSTDGSLFMLQKWADSDERIRVYEQRNSGAAKLPRDRAVYHAKGKFVVMLDADDLWSDDYLQKMWDRQQETQADIVYPRMLIINPENGKALSTLPVKPFDTRKVYVGKDLVKETMPQWVIGCNGGLYRKSVWVNMSYPVQNSAIWMNSDEIDERLYLLNAQRVAFAETFYYYLQHPTSITRSVTPKRFHTLKTSLLLLKLVSKEFGEDSEESRRANLMAFYDWRNKMALYVQNFRQLWAEEPYILSSLKDCFHGLRVDFLTPSERLQFMQLKHFYLVYLMVCMKYEPECLKEKLYRHFFPKTFLRKEASVRTRQKLADAVAQADVQRRNAVPIHGMNHSQTFATSVVNIFDGSVSSGGWVDRLRGIVSTFLSCESTGRDYRLYFVSPFRLEDYLVPNEVDWRIHKHDLTFSSSETENVIVDTLIGDRREKREQREQLMQGLEKSRDKQTHVYTNAAFCYDDDFAAVFRRLFKPSGRLQMAINERRVYTTKKYVTVSARFLNLMGDFNEENYSEPLGVDEREVLLEACKRQVVALRERYPKHKIVVCSDSTTFLKSIRSLKYTYVIPGQVSHIDNDGVHDYEYYEKTFTDFFIISQADKVFLLTGGGLMKSGYPYAAARIGEKPFETIEVDIKAAREAIKQQSML